MSRTHHRRPCPAGRVGHLSALRRPPATRCVRGLV